MSALLGTCGKAATVHNGICAEITIGADGETVEISRVDRLGYSGGRPARSKREIAFYEKVIKLRPEKLLDMTV
jgi:hypothetical protein